MVRTIPKFHMTLRKRVQYNKWSTALRRRVAVTEPEVSRLIIFKLAMLPNKRPFYARDFKKINFGSYIYKQKVLDSMLIKKYCRYFRKKQTFFKIFSL